MRSMLRYIPNILTISRIILAPIFFILFITNYYYLAIGCFFFASITDFLDGFLARKLNVVSNFGKLYDPLADKILIFLGCLCIVIKPPFFDTTNVPPITETFSSIFNLNPNIIVYLILALLLFRDLIVTTLREIKLRKDQFILKTNLIAKVKTAMLIIYIHLYLIYISLVNPYLPEAWMMYDSKNTFLLVFEKGASILLYLDCLLYLTLIFSLISLIDYINQYRNKSI